MIYPTKEGGKVILMPDIPDDKKTGKFGKKDEQGTYYHETNRIRNLSKKETRSNDMHFIVSITDVEATGYFKFLDEMDDFDVKLRGGNHSGSGNEDSAKCYIFRFHVKSFGKEYPHDGGKGYSWSSPKTGAEEGSEKGKPFKAFDVDFDSYKGKWVGLKGITINEGTGKVRCEMWLDFDGVDSSGQFDPNRQNWKRLYSIVDEDGKYGEDNDEHKNKKAWTENQVKSTIQFRVDAKTGTATMDYKAVDNFKNLSIREITPSNQNSRNSPNDCNAKSPTRMLC